MHELTSWINQATLNVKMISDYWVCNYHPFCITYTLIMIRSQSIWLLWLALVVSLFVFNMMLQYTNEYVHLLTQNTSVERTVLQCGPGWIAFLVAKRKRPHVAQTTSTGGLSDLIFNTSSMCLECVPTWHLWSDHSGLVIKPGGTSSFVYL